ncbi:MAG: DNA-binding response regulator [Planctomycetota bacterium]|nr:MAG: DNA-binding response regulator [Planctomycetota bacterium]
MTGEQLTGTVFVVDDDQAIRDSLERLLREVGLSVECFDSAQAFLARFDPDEPGALVIDVRMPGMSGLDVQKKLLDEGHETPVIIVTGHGDVPMAVEALKRGAMDFVEKPFRPQVLLDTIRQALEEDRLLRDAKHRKLDIASRFKLLTVREREVVDRVVNGATNKGVAAELGVSPQAIDARRARAMRKLQVGTVPELVQLFVKAQYAGVI